MQLNTLNRVIALFLVGGFVVLLATMSFEHAIRLFVQPYAQLQMGAPAGVFLAAALVSLTALAGAVVDAISNLTVRRFVRKVIGVSRSRCRLFWCAGEYDSQDRWRQAFVEALAESETLSAFGGDKQQMIKALSAGMFFRTADAELKEWLVQHHSMYHLSGNFVVVLIGGAFWCVSHRWWYGSIGCMASAYLLVTFALDNYLYTYQLSFRNAFLALKEPFVARDIVED